MRIPSPSSVTYKESKGNVTEIAIEPCYPGYGVTLGNTLRRVLLSSLPGAAVFAVKINGIQHEYDTLPMVKEDIVEILMNLKKLRLMVHSDEPVTIELSAKGEKEVTAGDIKKNAQCEVVNKDLVIATLTDKKAELSMEIMVKKGIGYEPIEERVVEKKEIGVIQIDSIFSPILNVGMNIDHVRVGQRTDYERVVLTVTTDGSCTAQEAMTDSIAIIEEQFGAISEASSEKKEKVNKKEKVEEVTEPAAE